MLQKQRKELLCRILSLHSESRVCSVILGALGIAGMWEAVFGDVGVTIIAVLNAMRILKK